MRVCWKTVGPQMGKGMAAQSPRNQGDTEGPTPASVWGIDSPREGVWTPGRWSPAGLPLPSLLVSFFTQAHWSWQPPGKGPAGQSHLGE